MSGALKLFGVLVAGLVTPVACFYFGAYGFEPTLSVARVIARTIFAQTGS